MTGLLCQCVELMELLIEPPDTRTGEATVDEPLRVVLKYRKPGQKVFGRRVAARLKLTVSEDRVLVTAPSKMPLRLIHEFVLENWDWVASQKKKLEARAPKRTLGPGAFVRVYGEHRRVVFENRDTGEILDSCESSLSGAASERKDDGALSSVLRFEIAGDLLLARVSAEVHARVAAAPEGFEESIARALCRFAEAEARLHLTDRVRYWSGQMGMRPSGISFRRQKTRWGSCSSEGHVSLNWKLIFAPEAVIDYVVIHELAHLKHQDHSKDFWDLVEKYDPEARLHRRWLRDHQNETRIFDV